MANKKNKKFFMITVSLALILAGIIGIIGFIKGQVVAKACGLNQTTCTLTGSSITGGVVGALQSGGIITGIVALFIVALGAVILINTMRGKE